MAHRFSSFVVRWWQSDAAQRLTLEHIQSGEKRVTASVDEAIAWLSAQHDARLVPPAGDEVACGDSNSKSAKTDGGV